MNLTSALQQHSNIKVILVWMLQMASSIRCWHNGQDAFRASHSSKQSCKGQRDLGGPTLMLRMSHVISVLRRKEPTSHLTL